MSKLSGDHIQVLVDGYDITGDSNRITINESRNLLDVTGFGDEVRKFIPGQRMMAVQHAGFMNSGEAGSHPALQGVDVDGLFSVYVGDNAGPRAGDPVFSMLTRQGRYGALPQVNQMIPFRAVFANRGDNGGWGVALTNPRRVIGSSSGSAVDVGIVTDGGGLACLHVLEAADSDVYTFSIEGSGSGDFTGEEINLATFALDGGAVGSEQVRFDGTIPRYVRWVASADAGGSDEIKIAISLIRSQKLIASPQGLLADFQFATFDPTGDLLLARQAVKGTRWLNLRKEDGTNLDIPLELMRWWDTSGGPASHHQPRFYGQGVYDWRELSALLPNASFYIYLPGDNQIFESPVISKTSLDVFHIGFDTAPRPASIVAGSQIRVLVADSGQAALIKKWIEAGHRPEVIASPGTAPNPRLTAGDGQVTVEITPPAQGGAPITTYELDVVRQDVLTGVRFVTSINSLSYTVEGLTNGRAYGFRVAAVNRGGRGHWSGLVFATPQSS